jgi:hypothetical protein
VQLELQPKLEARVRLGRRDLQQRVLAGVGRLQEGLGTQACQGFGWKMQARYETMSSTSFNNLTYENTKL